MDANSKQFKNEITETNLSENNLAEQPVVQDNGVQNSDAEKTSQGNVSTDDKKGQLQKEEARTTSNEDENTEKAEAQPIEKKVKDGRGRKPLSEEEKAKRASERANGGSTTKKDVADQQTSLDDYLSKYKETPVDSKTATTGSTQTAQPVNPKSDYIDMSKYVSGALFLIAIDIIMPTLSITIAGFIDKRYKHVDKKHLKLTTEEKKELEPVAEQVVKILFGYVHPVVAFGVMLSIMYMGKIMMISDDVLENAEIKMNKKALQKKGGK